MTTQSIPPINDGGPAFPQTITFCDGQPQIAGQYFENSEGMTMRDWFAGQALANSNIEEHCGMEWADRVADQAFRIADAMIAARSRQPSTQPTTSP
jgi:hypothetical protein